MALIKCKECKSEVSSKADTCPKCGVKIAKKNMGCGSLLVISFLGLIIYSMFSSFFSAKKLDETKSETEYASPAAAVSTLKTTTPGSQWDYSQSADPMSNGITHFASVYSSNTVNFKFPYAGEQRGALHLRINPRSGKNVYFQIEKGQVQCSSYSDCTVLVRFDDGKAMNYTAVGAADNSTETIFIRNEERFIEAMKKARTVRISANIYQQGAPIFEFDVSDFDQEKFKPQNSKQ